MESLSKPPLSIMQTRKWLSAKALAMEMPAGPAPMMQTSQWWSLGADGSR